MMLVQAYKDKLVLKAGTLDDLRFGIEGYEKMGHRKIGDITMGFEPVKLPSGYRTAISVFMQYMEKEIIDENL